MSSALRLRKITGFFGLEVSNFDSDDDAHLASLSGLLCDNAVVVLREAALTHAQQVTLAKALGEPTPAHPVVPGHPDYPEILELDGAKGGKNSLWHTDVTFVATPPAASILVADQLPEVGGDTMFCDMRSALAALNPALRTMINDLTAVHHITPLAYWGDPYDSAMSLDEAHKLLRQSESIPPIAHPVVRVHPVTGVPSLFVNPGFASHIMGMARHESRHILDLLFAHATQPEFCLRHQWSNGDVVMWDNRATMHYAIDDYGAASRKMRRVTIRGDAPVGPTGFVSHVVTDPRVYMIGSPTR